MNPIEQDWSTTAAAELLAAMGNPRRLEVLRYLTGGEATVGQIVEVVGMSQSALSQHLAVLRRAALVKTRRTAQNIHYSISSHLVVHVLAALGQAHSPNTEGTRQRDHASLSKARGEPNFKSP